MICHVIGHLFRNINYCTEINLVVNEETASQGGLDHLTQFYVLPNLAGKEKLCLKISHVIFLDNCHKNGLSVIILESFNTV